MKLLVRTRTEALHCTEARYVYLEAGQEYAVVRQSFADGRVCFEIPALGARISEAMVTYFSSLELVDEEIVSE